LILVANIRIVRNPQLEEVLLRQDWISYVAEVSILVAAGRSRVDFLATLNTKHFIEDPQVAHHSGLRIGTPGEALVWVREQSSKTS
jgi:hypothetical protein